VTRDRNLLFGILAVQLRKITPEQLVEAGAGWAADPSRELPQRLQEAGAIGQRDCELIVALVDQAIAVHDGDATAALDALGGEEEVERSFRGSASSVSAPDVAAGEPAADTDRTVRLDSDALAPLEEAAGRYSRIGEQGRGGFGRVLLARDRCLGRDIALKELLLPHAGSSTVEQRAAAGHSTMLTARFLQEARITGQLEHPSIVPVYELGRRSNGKLYYTMKLVRGRSLAATLRESSSLGQRLELLPRFVDLCQAIAYAHSRGVIHRDIKPGNVMIGEFGETVVIDWGLAKARGREDIHAEEIRRTFHALRLGNESDSTKTSYGEAIGTPVYMPPEQARGTIDLIDERSDIYSLGAVLYELLTGRAPFSGDSALEVIDKVINQDPRPVTEIEPRVPPELAAICRRAMARRPEDRYPAALALADEIQRFLSGAVVESYQYGFVEHTRRLVRRHRVVVVTSTAFLVTLVLVLLLATGWNLRERHRAEHEAATAERVSIFLEGLFEDLDPGQSKSPTVTVAEFLDQSLDKVRRGLSDEPLIQARLTHTIGGVYRELGAYQQAEELLEQALASRESLRGSDHPEVAATLISLGRLYRATGRFAEAEPLHQRAVVILAEVFGADSPELAAGLDALGNLYAEQGRYEEAETTHRRALALREAALGRDDLQVSESLNSLGVVYEKQGRLEEAGELFERSLAIKERVHGTDHPKLVWCLHNLANICARQGRFEEAESLHRRSLAIREAAFGPDHPKVAATLSSLMNLALSQNRLDLAEPLGQRALEILESTHGPDHPHVAAVLDALARIRFAQGDSDGAEEHLRRSLAIRERAFGENHPEVATSLLNLGWLYRSQGRLAPAEHHLRRAATLLEESLGAAHPTVAKARLNLAAVYRDRGKLDEALAACQTSVGSYEQALGKDHPTVAEALTTCADILRQLGRDAEAATLEQRARAIVAPPGAD